MDKQRKNVIIYCGASLSLAEIFDVLGGDTTVYPPIKRGDLKKNGENKIIGIIDGVFDGALSVSPQEIKDSMRDGNVIFGSSSMGALRAVELEREGMIGIGKIFQAFKSGYVNSDAEVAMIFSAKNYIPLSEPLIHIRFFLKDMVKQNILLPYETKYIEEQLEKIYFPDLTYDRLFGILQEYMGSDKVRAIQQYYLKHKDDYNIKKQDARELLQAIKVYREGLLISS